MASPQRRTRSFALRVPPQERLRQRAFTLLGAVSTPLVRLLSKLLGGRPRPEATKLPTRRFGDTAFCTPAADLESALSELSAAAAAWASTPFAERARLARACARLAGDSSEALAASATSYKGTFETGDGEEIAAWAASPWLLNELATTLDELARGCARAPASVRTTKAGRKVVTVFPSSFFDHLLFAGLRGELHLSPEAGTPTAGGSAVLGGPGCVCLVLGAGNQATVALADVCLKALVHGCTCVLAVSPVNEWAGPHLERTLHPLVQAGALRVVYGGLTTGKLLTAHPVVSCVHMTGSDATYDAVVWGGAAKGPGRTPPYRKPVSAELGCVTPMLLVPGRWSTADLDAKAAEVVASVAHNASCNCLATKVLVLSARWAQKDAFLDVLKRKLTATAARCAFYPGSAQKYDAFAAAYPDAVQLGVPSAPSTAAADCRRLPFLLLPPAPLRAGDKAVTDEAWSPVLAVRELDTPAEEVPSFLTAAAAALNDACWGTLSCAVYIHPHTQAAHAAAFEEFIAALRYGSVGVNVPTCLNYILPPLSWGAFPGHTADDIRSGVGQIHNSFLVDNVEKSVLWAPWQPAVTPFWSVEHGNMPALSRRITEHFTRPNVLTLTRLVIAAVRG